MSNTNGSSPHTWGIPPSQVRRNQRNRFIPTYVGHTSCILPALVLQSVHPHIRGAYITNFSRRLSYIGSSPHTWGILDTGNVVFYSYRFIPTYVGHTLIPLATVIFFSVHPHIRGAYGTGPFHSLLDIGSSPHTWGIHWTAVRKTAGFSHFSYDFIRKSYFVQGLVFFGVIGAEASLSHRRGRSQCLSGSHGGSVRNL